MPAVWPALLGALGVTNSTTMSGGGRAQEAAIGRTVAPQMVADHRRRLVTVITHADLVTEIAGTAPTIELEAGTYAISSTISVSRDYAINAKVSGSSVVLDGGGSTCSKSMHSGDAAHLIGPTFKDGNVSVPTHPYSLSRMNACEHASRIESRVGSTLTGCELYRLTWICALTLRVARDPSSGLCQCRRL